jgi:nicotinate-nucleotide adenylyltransferase
LERVLFVPAAHPPHKLDSLGATFEDRYAMVELACAIDRRFEASRLEDGSGMSYSIDTVEKIRGQAEDLFFIIGADAFAEITTWHRWRELMQLTQFIVVTRPGHDGYECPDGARMHRLDTLALPVSSSDIRQKLLEGQVPEELPEAVAKYIQARGLYQTVLDSMVEGGGA